VRTFDRVVKPGGTTVITYNPLRMVKAKNAVNEAPTIPHLPWWDCSPVRRRINR
jgi:hypothetical protein